MDVLKEKRLGRFLISLEALGLMDQMTFSQVFSNFRILRADIVTDGTVIDYLAGSMMFEPIANDIPYYSIKIRRDNMNQIIIDVEQNETNVTKLLGLN